MAKQQDTNDSVKETLDDDSSVRVYELGFHLDPELSTEEMKKSYEEVRKFITDRSALITEGEPQKIQLAYTISRQDTHGRRDFDSAYFSWIVYETTALLHAEILKTASSNKKIIRFIDLITTKDAARHSFEMRELSAKSLKRTDDSEEVATAELDAALENVVV